MLRSIRAFVGGGKKSKKQRKTMRKLALKMKNPEIEANNQEEVEEEGEVDDEAFFQNALDEFIEKMGQHQKFSRMEYSEFFKIDERTLKGGAINPNERVMRKQLFMLIKGRSKWSSENGEVFDFRETMKRLYERNDRNDSSGSFGLERYFGPKTKFPKKKIGLRIRVTRKVIENCEFSQGDVIMPSFDVERPFIEISSRVSAKDLIIGFIKLVNSKVCETKYDEEDLDEASSELVLKVCGELQYIYGPRRLDSFEIIQKYMNLPGKFLELDCRIREEELDSRFCEEEIEHFKHLKNIDYDFEWKTKGGPRQVELSFIKFKHRLEDMRFISMWDLKSEFLIKINNFMTIDNPDLVTSEEEEKIEVEELVCYVHVKLLYGDVIIGEKFTQCLPYSKSINWNQTLRFSDFQSKLLTCDLPRETVICMTVYGRKENSGDYMLDCTSGKGRVHPKDIPLGGLSRQLIDYKGFLLTGVNSEKLHMNQVANLWMYTPPKISDQILSYQLEEYCLPVLFPVEGKLKKHMVDKLAFYQIRQLYRFSRYSGKKELLQKKADELLKTTSLDELTDDQKWMLWDAREDLKGRPELLPYFLMAVPYQFPHAIFEAHRMLKEWARPRPVDCLELLDYKYADRRIRIYALEQINRMSNEELLQYDLQLINALKFELYHDSPLARFILQRALKNPHDVGHQFYWDMRSEMDDELIQERYGLILEEFLLRCGSFRIELLKMTCVTDQLLDCALEVKRIKGKGREKKEQRARLFRHLLRKVYLPYHRFKIPLFPRYELQSIQADRGKVFTSKKLPLMVVFDNLDTSLSQPDPIIIMFKAGDDLRQDILTLQMLKIMDRMWKREGMDLHLSIYSCICTGYMTGMLEIVKKSTTIADIQHEKGIFDKSSILNWLRETGTEEKIFLNNFIHSCAGYCVATYAIGIGDRHNDNVMIKSNGSIFHIDFGHFLGHRKKFLGVKRETTPFVFTHTYCTVLGGEKSKNFKKFQKLSCRAYNVLRNNVNFIINMFLMMIGCGIPELQDKKDVEFIKDAMVMNLNRKQAEDYFKTLIQKAMGNVRQEFNDTWHVLYHKVIHGH